MVEEHYEKVTLHDDEFNLLGLLGGGGSGGGGGDIDIGALAGQFLSGDGGKEIGNFLGGLMGGGGSGGGGGGSGNIDAGALIGGLSSLMGGGGDRGELGNGGGANFDPKTHGSDGVGGGFKGQAVDFISRLAGNMGHRYLGIDPETGRQLAAIAGNALFGLGGKDNGLGNIGKLLLDNIITGKFKRKVEPYVPIEPTPIPSQPGPRPAPDPSDGQNFNDLRQKGLDDQTLFEDPDFPASDESLFYSRSPPKLIEWKRPGEICEEPCLFVEGHSRFDVIQGELGDCWLLAATAILTMRDELFYRVCPPDQSFTENYDGIFHFQFWQYGTWVDVVIDDRLPTADGELLYMHSKSNNEFWSALLEKAYAKLHGSYEALKGGSTSEALADFTGGLTEFYDLRQNAPRNLEQLMIRANEMGSMLACSIEADPQVYEARLRNGLVRGHAYSITGMQTVNHPRYGQTLLLRIRNPWGNEQEWNGAWSDGWSGWEDIDDDAKAEMELTYAHDGENWISFDDFRREFEKLEICNLGPDVVGEVQEMMGVEIAQALTWNSSTHDAAWIAGETAGGCRNFINTFGNNPQIYIGTEDADPDDDDALCTCVLSVTQKYRRQLRSKGLDMLSIGFAVYEANSGERLDSEFFSYNKAVARCAAFINLREVTTRCRLPPGGYVIIPSTFDPDEEGEFQVRIFSTGHLDAREL